MAKSITTESIESKTKVFGNFDVFDLFFVMLYVFLCYGLRIYVHPMLRVAFLVFSAAVAVFLISPSLGNKKRKNYESIYFLLARDVTVYHPFVRKEEERD